MSRKQSTVGAPKSAAQPKEEEAQPDLVEIKEVVKAVRTPHKIPPGMDEYTQCCPPGLYRMFFTGATQNAFSIVGEEDITQEENIKTINKQAILEDIYKKNVGSDFSPVRKLVEDYPEEDILVIYDYDFQFDKNYYLCLDLDLKDIILDVSRIFLFFLLLLLLKITGPEILLIAVIFLLNFLPSVET